MRILPLITKITKAKFFCLGYFVYLCTHYEDKDRKSNA